MQVLYGRHQVRAFRFGLRLVRDEEVAERPHPRGFLDVWRQAGKFESRSAFPPDFWQLRDSRPCLRCAAGRTLKLDDEAANAIEESVEEVAEIVGIQGNAGKTRLFYARRKLAELLKAAGVERGWP
jgi:RNA polymerase sigma-70 factor (ECF subfamily)